MDDDAYRFQLNTLNPQNVYCKSSFFRLIFLFEPFFEPRFPLFFLQRALEHGWALTTWTRRRNGRGPVTWRRPSRSTTEFSFFSRFSCIPCRFLCVSIRLSVAAFFICLWKEFCLEFGRRNETDFPILSAVSMPDIFFLLLFDFFSAFISDGRSILYSRATSVGESIDKWAAHDCAAVLEYLACFHVFHKY